MKKWKSYSSDLANKSYDTIVIGSGIGGLCSAALLALKGKRVLVLEKHFKIGGWTHTFRRNKYEWDVGIHYIGQVHNKYSPVRKLFDLISDGKLRWSKMDENYDRIIFPDKVYDFIAPKEQFIENMIDYFPKEENSIIKYIKLLDEASLASRSYFANKAMPGILGPITYPFMTRNFFKYSDKTTMDVLLSLTNDRKLISVLTGQWGDYGLPPSRSSFAMHAAVARHYLDGANYPTGTSRRIAETISDLIEKNNGILAVNAEIKNIEVSKGKAIGVTMSNGDTIEAKNIISNAGVVNTIKNLVDKPKENIKNLDKNLKNITQTGSYVCLHLGINKSVKSLGIKNTNLWVYPDYDHDKNVLRYSEDKSADFPVVYISFPSAKDSDWSIKNPNSGTVEAITMSSWDWFSKWESLKWKKRGADYEAEKEAISNKILDIVLKQNPALKGTIDYKELSTPLTVRDLASYEKGEMYGIDHSPHRFRQKWLKPESEIKNLFFTGQDITTVGVSSAIFSGLLTASAVLKENLSHMLKGGTNK